MPINIAIEEVDKVKERLSTKVRPITTRLSRCKEDMLEK